MASPVIEAADEKSQRADYATGSALFRRACAGGKTAWGLLLDGERSGLRRFARRWLPRKLWGKESASDLVQRTFLAADVCRSKFRGEKASDLGGWLKGILRNTARRVGRHFNQAKRNVGKEAATPPLETPDPSFTAAEKAARNEMRDRVTIAVEALPAEIQMVIRMRIEEDMSFPQIAFRLERNEAAVRMQFRRALKKLGKQLGPLD